MGTKYSSNSASGYNATPPADDGTVSEANKVKWSTAKTKLADPIKDLADAINTDIVSHFDRGPTAVTSNTTLGASDFNKIIQVSGAAVTLTLTDAATLAAGWYVDIVSTDTTNNVTIARATASNTINETSADITLLPLQQVRAIVNAAATGFLIDKTLRFGKAVKVNEELDFTGGVKANGTAGKAGQAWVVTADEDDVAWWAPRDWLAGLTISNAADTDHDITVAVGEATNSDNDAVMKLTSAITKQADATWAVGTNAGGMASGESLPANGRVNLWQIQRSDTGVVDFMFNNHATSGESPTLPTNYDRKRLIAKLLTNPSSNFYQVSQDPDNREIVYDSAGAVANIDIPLSLISSVVSSFQLIIEDATPGTDATDLMMRISLDDAATFIALGNYHEATHLLNVAGTETLQVSTTATGYRLAASIGTAANEVFNGVINLHDFRGASTMKQITGHGFYRSSAATNIRTTIGGTYNVSNAAVTHIRLLMSSGNVDARFKLKAL